MAPKFALLAAALCAVALSGCTAGDDGGDGSQTTTTTASGGVGVGGNASVGNTSVSGSYTVGGNATGNTTGNSTDAPMAADVVIQGNAFVNSTVTVRAGGTVTWTHNDGTTQHTVTADDGSFDSSPNCAPTVGPLPPTGDCLTQGETFSTTFATPGTYTYHCKVHSGMTGTVEVVA